MPITPSIPLRPISQPEFARIAYEVTGHALSVRRELGGAFDECVYRRTLAHLLRPNAIEEFPIRLTHNGFEKTYYLDILVDAAGPFELKAASRIHDRHRAQLIQYLMLTNLKHGKLINFGGEKVQHEFVNCHESTEHRQSFMIDTSRWSAADPAMRRFEGIVVDLLRDWGTGLDRGLYIEAISYFFGGPEVVRRSVQTFWDGTAVGTQVTNCVAEGLGFEVTCLRGELALFEDQLTRFVEHTSLERLFWVNISSGRIQFIELGKKSEEKACSNAAVR